MTMKRTVFELLAFYAVGIFFLSSPLECRVPFVNNDDLGLLPDLKQPVIEILFLANLNGNLENCHCGNPSLGGLPQIYTLITEKRVKNPDILVIDGGDFLNSYPFEALNRTTVEIYQLINPDYLMLGDQEFYESTPFTRRLIQKFAGRIVAGNYSVEGIPLNPSFRLQSGKNKHISLTSFLDERAFFHTTNPGLVHSDRALFDKTYQQLPEKDFTIALFHGPRYQLDWFRETYSRIDLILFGHEQSYLSDLDRKPAVIGGGSDGEHIIHIEVYAGAIGYEYKHKAIPVTLQIKADERINAIIERFKNHVKQQSE